MSTPIARPSASSLSRLPQLNGHSFAFRTLQEAFLLAHQLARYCPRSKDVELGLRELMINAVEHGNLEIDAREKETLLRSGGWVAEIERRLSQPQYTDRRAVVTVASSENGIDFDICDQGTGFDFAAFEAERERRPAVVNGRGIWLARAIAFDEVIFREPGNRVIARLRRRP